MFGADKAILPVAFPKFLLCDLSGILSRGDKPKFRDKSIRIIAADTIYGTLTRPRVTVLQSPGHSVNATENYVF